MQLLISEKKKQKNLVSEGERSETSRTTERSRGENSWGFGGAVSLPMGVRGSAPENFEIVG